ncbi:MAG: ComEC/Rec2 family competence protein [SAR324 cluster bacterium]|nr:ComEC/Rec2 family competence protein [SAR324 cluster bacterium]
MPRIWRLMGWCPFAFGMIWCAYLGLGGTLRYDLGLVLLAGGMGAAWLLGMRLWLLALLALLLLSPLAYRLEVALPRQAGELRSLAPESYLRIRGTVRRQTLGRAREEREPWLLLGEAEVSGAGGVWRFDELQVLMPRDQRKMRVYYRREVRIGGKLERTLFQEGRFSLRLREAEYHLATRPIGGWRAEGLRTALRDRAAYYLRKPALAIYLPIVLGVRERKSPEAREVVGAFRRVGISHLFAISGLHIGLLFLLLLAVSHQLIGLLLRGQGLLRVRTTARVVIMGLIWIYIALIGFPIPAVRAAIMVSMLVWGELWGTRTPRLYLLCLAALILVGITPSVIYDVSFQLSFLSFFFLISALNFQQSYRLAHGTPALQGMMRRLLSVGTMNLAVTLAITLGIWPVVAINFGQLSLLVFLGNLLMIPILSLVVLPSGLLAMLISLAYLGQVPGGGLEYVLFTWLQWVLDGWLWLIQLIDRLGGALVFPMQLDWQPRQLFLYYAALLAGILLLARLSRFKTRAEFSASTKLPANPFLERICAKFRKILD